MSPWPGRPGPWHPWPPLAPGPPPCAALCCPALPCPALPCPALPALPCPALPCPALPLPCPALPALPCPALPCPALPCPALPCPALPCPALPCPALPCPARPCPALPCPALPCPALPCPASAEAHDADLRTRTERRMRNSISAGAHAKAEDGFSASSGPALGKVGPGSHRSGARTAALADAFVTLQRVTCTVDVRTGRRSCSSSPLARRAQTAVRPRLSWRASLNPRQLLRPGANLVCQCQTEASLPGPHRTCFVA